MAENYSLNPQFGTNVSSGKSNTSTSRGAELAEEKFNFFSGVTDYVDKYENVFTGNVEREINMYERQALIVGMNLRAGEIKRNFDMSI